MNKSSPISRVNCCNPQPPPIFPRSPASTFAPLHSPAPCGCNTPAACITPFSRSPLLASFSNTALIAVSSPASTLTICTSAPCSRKPSKPSSALLPPAFGGGRKPAPMNNYQPPAAPCPQPLRYCQP